MPTPNQIFCVMLLTVAAGCASTDPYTREGEWHPNGSNDANLRAMVAMPADLAIGQGDGNGDSQLAEAAVERLRRDKVKALPASGIAEFSVSGSSSGSGSSGSSGGTGASSVGGP